MMNNRPITAGMIRAAGKAPASSSAELASLLNTLAETVGAVLREFTTTPVRVEPDGFLIAARETPVPESASIRLVSSRGSLTASFMADRTLVMALCEAAFGGSGTEAPFDGAERPLSKTERHLREALLSALATKMPEALALCFGMTFGMADDEERRPPSREIVTVSYITGKLLVYTFGYSGELTVLLPEEEAARMVASARGTHHAPPQPRAHFLRILQESQIEISALLPAETKPLGEVARLRRGQLLKFNADANSPVLLMAEGTLLGRARMRPGGEAVTMEIVDR